MRKLLTDVIAFVDWNAQFHNYNTNRIIDLNHKADFTLEKLARTISRFLLSESDQRNFRVTMRLYHGWYRGFQPSENKIAIINAIAKADFSEISRSPSVVISETVEFGDVLLDALPERKLSRPPIHLPNTLRRQDGGDVSVEKMVDTALAADLLSWARHQSDEWALILAEDDDLIPPIYVAESWMNDCDGRVLMIRHRVPSRKFLKCDGLVHQVANNVNRS